MRGIHRWPVNSPRKAPVTRKMFPFYNVIMINTVVWLYLFKKSYFEVRQRVIIKESSSSLSSYHHHHYHHIHHQHHNHHHHYHHHHHNHHYNYHHHYRYYRHHHHPHHNNHYPALFTHQWTVPIWVPHAEAHNIGKYMAMNLIFEVWTPPPKKKK